MITWKRDYIAVADYHSIPSIIVEESPRRRKQGLSGYRIECFMWYGKMRYEVQLDCFWFTDCYTRFDTLKDAWKYLDKIIGRRIDQ